VEVIFFFRKAKLLLRKKKFGETQIEKMDGQLENIERMVIGKQVFTADKMDT